MFDHRSSDHRLAFPVVVALVLVPEQGLVALHLVRLGAHGTRGGGENDRDDHEGGDYCHGDDFGQGESLTWKEEVGEVDDYYLRLLHLFKARLKTGPCENVRSNPK